MKAMKSQMNGRRMGFVRALIAVVVSLTAAGSVTAQEFPNHQVTIISPYQAGGTSDLIARIVAQKLGEYWRHPVIVENKPGANGVIGTVAAARATPDGYTLLATASSVLTINPLVFRNLPYDFERDFAPLSRTGLVPNVLVVNKEVEAKSVVELIALAKAKPNTLNYASQGIGSNGQLNAELFRQQTGIALVHVPYKGSAPAVTDMLSGQVQVMFDNLPTVLEQVRTGNLRALAVTTANRTPTLPDVPTVAEAGVAGFDTSAWFALLVAKGVPPSVRGEIERAVVQALKDDDVRSRLKAVGIEPLGGGSAELAERIKAETDIWRDVVSKAAIKVD